LKRGGGAQEQDCPGWLRTDGLQEERTVHWPSKEVPLELTLSIFLSLSGCVCVRACASLSLCFSHFLYCFVSQGFSLSLAFSLTRTHTHTVTRSLSFTHSRTRTYAPNLYPHFSRTLTHISLSLSFSSSLSLSQIHTHTHTHSRTHILSLLHSPTTWFILLACERCAVFSERTHVHSPVSVSLPPPPFRVLFFAILFPYLSSSVFARFLARRLSRIS